MSVGESGDVTAHANSTDALTAHQRCLWMWITNIPTWPEMLPCLKHYWI